MLVVFKSAPILKRTLKVKHAMLQLYVLKLLKMQTKYLGRQWRKSNMKTMSAIYTKVRHRLNDDWAFGNDVDSRPWDFQAEECALRAAVDRYEVYPRRCQISAFYFSHLDSTTGATTRLRQGAWLGAGRCWGIWSRWTTVSTPCWARSAAV